MAYAHREIVSKFHVKRIKSETVRNRAIVNLQLDEIRRSWDELEYFLELRIKLMQDKKLNWSRIIQLDKQIDELTLDYANSRVYI